jgi:hypothetical protein
MPIDTLLVRVVDRTGVEVFQIHDDKIFDDFGPHAMMLDKRIDGGDNGEIIITPIYQFANWKTALTEFKKAEETGNYHGHPVTAGRLYFNVEGRNTLFLQFNHVVEMPGKNTENEPEPESIVVNGQTLSKLKPHEIEFLGSFIMAVCSWEAIKRFIRAFYDERQVNSVYLVIGSEYNDEYTETVIDHIEVCGENGQLLEMDSEKVRHFLIDMVAEGHIDEDEVEAYAQDPRSMEWLISFEYYDGIGTNMLEYNYKTYQPVHPYFETPLHLYAPVKRTR